jgi:Holliday junction resolvase RusA-like endonuclease
MIFNLCIPGRPIAKARPRFARRGPYVKTYSTQQTEEGRFLFELQQQWRREPLEGALAVKIFFYMPIPQSVSKKLSFAMSNGEANHTKKPDLSNMIKFVEDCMNGLVWRDDSQIVRLVADKNYGVFAHTEIEIEEIG